MSYKINGTVVVDNSRKVYACCVDAYCILPSVRFDAPSGFTVNRPASPAIGSIFFDRDLGALLTYDGTDWKTSGSEPNGIDGSPTYVSAYDSPYVAYTQQFVCIGDFRGATEVHMNGNITTTTFGDFSGLLQDTASLTIDGVGTICGRRVLTNNMGPIASCLCGRYLYSRSTCWSPHILNDGSMFSITKYEQCTPMTPAVWYGASGCDGRRTYTVFSCLMASDGRHGELTWPISVANQVTLHTDYATATAGTTLVYGCGLTSHGLTHLAVPYGSGPFGKCQISVGSATSTYPTGYTGVAAACNFGKVRFNFDFLYRCDDFERYINGIPHKCPVNRQTTPGTSCCNYDACLSLFPVPDFEAWWCACVCFNLTCPLTTCQGAFVHWFSKQDLSVKSAYCTATAVFTCPPHPETGLCLSAHQRCTFNTDYGLYYVINPCFNCIPAVCGVKGIQSLATNKHFVFHAETNPLCACCIVGLNCAGTLICSKTMMMLESFDIENFCKTACISYKCWINDAGLAVEWSQVACQMAIYQWPESSYTNYLQDKNDPTKHYFGSNICVRTSVCGKYPCNKCAGSNFILTFCETTCNFTALFPWAGLCSSNSGINCYLVNGCFRPSPVSCNWILASTTPTTVCLARPCAALSSGRTTGGFEYFNPCTSAFVTALMIIGGVAPSQCTLGIYLACYDLVNKCWSEGAIVWDAEIDHICHGKTGANIGPWGPGGYYNICSHFQFTGYDSGEILEIMPCAMNCAITVGSSWQECTNICNTGCTQVRGNIFNLVYKIPYNKKFCDIPGLLNDPCVPALLNYNVVNNLGNACLERESPPLFSCLCLGKRLTQKEYVGMIKPTDSVNTTNGQYNYCILANANCAPKAVLDGSWTNRYIYTMSTDPNKYHSDFIQERLGITIKPGGTGSTATPFRLGDYSKSQVHVKAGLGYNVCLCLPTVGFTYCT